MAFGQQSGPPAPARRVQHLVALVVEAGHVDLRDARGALGLTQRQAAGKFTRDEAEELIERLESDAERARLAAEGEVGGPAGGAQPAPDPGPAATRPVAQRRARSVDLRPVPSEQLAAELQRRGWVVMEP